MNSLKKIYIYYTYLSFTLKDNRHKENSKEKNVGPKMSKIVSNLVNGQNKKIIEFLFIFSC